MKHPKLLPAILALCGLLSSPASLFGQVAPSPADQTVDDEMEDTFTLPTFRVESETVDRYRAAEALSGVRIRSELIETPNSISVITSDFIRDIKPVRLVDVTRYVAGVQDVSGTANYGDMQIIRGFGSQSRTIDYFRDIASYNFDETMIERIEVSKGPNALMSPHANPGGALNVVLKSPQFTRNHVVTALLGEYDAQKVTIDLADRIDRQERFAYRLVGAYQDAQRYWGRDYRIRRKIIMPSFAWRVNDRTDFVAKYISVDSMQAREPQLVLDLSVSRPGQKPFIDPAFRLKGGSNGTAKWSRVHHAADVLHFQFTTSINPHITARLAGMWQRADWKGAESSSLRGTRGLIASSYNPYTGEPTPRQSWDLEDPSLDHDAITNRYVPSDTPLYDPTNLVRTGTRHDLDRNEQYSVQNDWVLVYELPMGMKSQTIIGAAYTDQTQDRLFTRGTLPVAVNLFDLDAVDDTVIWNNYNDGDARAEEAMQFYMNQRMTALQGRLALTGGWLRYKADSRTYGVDRSGIRSARDVLKGDKDVYLASILYRLTPRLSVYYSYSANAEPSVANNLTIWREGQQHEYGVKSEFFNRRLAISAAYFDITQDGVTIINTSSSDSALREVFIRDFENYGFELEVTGAITSSLSVLSSFSHIKMRDLYGRGVVGLSENTASAFFNYRFSEGRLNGLGLSLGVNYVGEATGDTPAIDLTPLGVVAQPSWSVPSYTQWTGGVNYVWGHYGLSLNIENLAGKKDFIKSAGGRNSTYGISVMRPTTARLAITVKL